MASIVAGADRRMSIGRVFSRAFGAIGANPLTMFGIAFLFGALPTAVLNLLLQNGRSFQNTGFTVATALAAIGLGLLTIVFIFFAQGALVRATTAHSDGQPVSFRDSALTGVRKIVPLFVLGLLIGIAVMFGLILLIVPGIILYLVWSVATPALVEEKVGIFGAFGRSAFLTRGARWNVFAIQLVALVLYWMVSAVAGIVMLLVFGVQGMATAAQSGTPVLFVLVNAVSSTILLTLISAIQTALYVELRDWKEGPATDALTDIFG